MKPLDTGSLKKRALDIAIAIAVLASIVSALVLMGITALLHPVYQIGDVVKFGHYEQTYD